MQMMYVCNVYVRILKQRRISRYLNLKKLKNVKVIGVFFFFILIVSFCYSKNVFIFILKNGINMEFGV